jgi:hypothetical protein
MKADHGDRANWVDRPEVNLFSDENMAAVLAAFQRRNAVVFGWQYSYFGGGSRSEVTFISPDQYLNHVERARPGDHFTLFDLDGLVDRAVLRLGDVRSTDSLELDAATPIGLAGSRRSLDDVLGDEDAEVLVLRRFVGPLTGTIDVTLMSLPGTGSERQADFQRNLHWGRGELVLFDERLFHEDEHGGTVETVTPLDRRRIHALIDAKRPSPEGTVPLSGAY